MSGDYEDDEYGEREISKYELDALMDAEYEGRRIMQDDARAERDRWRDRVEAEVRELEARADLGPAAIATTGEARRELGAIHDGEEPELLSDEGYDEPRAIYVFVDAEERLARAELLAARARVEAEHATPPTPPTWEELTGQGTLFDVDAPIASSGSARRPWRAGVHARVVWRARNVCEVCRAPASDDSPPQIGHIVSLDDGLGLGIAPAVLNSEENLVLECRYCNLGHGRETLPLWLVVAILKARDRPRD